MVLLIFSLLFALLVAIFAIQNADPVAVQFLWMVFPVPLVLVILGSVLAGAMIVLLIALWREFRLKRKYKEHQTVSTPPALPPAPNLPSENAGTNEENPLKPAE